MRAWLLVRLGCDWRKAVLSVIIDRGVGVGLLVALGFVILLLPAGLTALGEYRDVIVIVYGGVLLAGGGFQHGQHLPFDPQNPPPLCNLYVSMLQRLGIHADRFGSSTGTLPGLEAVG